MSLSDFRCRAFQSCFGLGARLLPWRMPALVEGEGSLQRVPALLDAHHCRRPLIVASARQCAAEPFVRLCESLEGRAIRPSLFTGVTPNPTVETVETMVAQYRRDGCDSLLAIGGGSPIDAAKVAGARIARPERTVAQLGGLLKVLRRIPLLIAVPTTAGTGSEATIAAVVTDAQHHKFSVSDLCLIPRYAVLDPALTLSLPPFVTAQTGMDALTHAVEAYLSRYYNTKETRVLCESAVAAIFRALPFAVRDGSSLPARETLLRASYDAGVAFTRASVGNVHALAHTLGGLYGTAHGLANAVLLPLVLEDYGEAVYSPLARLAAVAGFRGETEQALALRFIAAIRAMNDAFGIPRTLACIREEDIPQMVRWAAAEANPVYPVPVIYDEARFARVLRRAMDGAQNA